MNPHNDPEVGSSFASFYRQRQGTEKQSVLPSVTKRAKLGSLAPEPMSLTTLLKAQYLLHVVKTVLRKISYLLLFQKPTGRLLNTT